MPVKPSDNKMTTTSNDSASKPAAQLSTSRLCRNSDEMTTTASDARTKTVEESLSKAYDNVHKMTSVSDDSAPKPAPLSSSCLCHNDNEITAAARDTRTKNLDVSLSEACDDVNKMMPTPSSIRTAAASPSPSASHSTDAKITVKSTDQIVQPVAQKIVAVNETEDENNRTTDKVVVNAPADEFHVDAFLDVRTPVTKPHTAVGGDAMDVCELSEFFNDKSPSLCNQQVKVN